MRARRLSYVPEAYSYPSYGAADTGSGTLSLDEQIRGVKAFLGIDDPRAQVARLENRLRDLRLGTPAEKTKAMIEAGAFTVASAIQKTQVKLAEAQSAAAQTSARDKLYTALVVTGVVTGGMLALVLATTAYSRYQQASVYRAERERMG
jgi:hypothetical protein